MGAPPIPKPPALAKTPDPIDAQIKALDYAATQRLLKKSQGRQGMFLVNGQTGNNTLLGQ